MTIHEFPTSLDRGKKGEAVLEAHFTDLGWTVEKPTREEDHLGIDRWHTKDGERYSVQYKTDYETKVYGNVFLESVSNDRTGTKGWLWTCKADWLFLLMNGVSETDGSSDYFVFPGVTTLANRCRKGGTWGLNKIRASRNKGPGYNYCSHGIIVPVKDLDLFYPKARRTIPGVVIPD